MYLNLFDALASMTKEELEKEITELSLNFTDNESSTFEKGKEFSDETIKFGANDSNVKVLRVLLDYYLIKSREHNGKK